MSKELFDLIKQADNLAPEEQLRLLSHLVQKISLCQITPPHKYKVTDFMGIAPNHLGGMDAQEYITRMRRGEFPELEITQMESRKD
jgi:hypothetical protein